MSPETQHLPHAGYNPSAGSAHESLDAVDGVLDLLGGGLGDDEVGGSQLAGLAVRQFVEDGDELLELVLVDAGGAGLGLLELLGQGARLGLVVRVGELRLDLGLRGGEVGDLLAQADDLDRRSIVLGLDVVGCRLVVGPAEQVLEAVGHRRRSEDGGQGLARVLLGGRARAGAEGLGGRTRRVLGVGAVDEGREGVLVADDRTEAIEELDLLGPAEAVEAVLEVGDELTGLVVDDALVGGTDVVGVDSELHGDPPGSLVGGCPGDWWDSRSVFSRRVAGHCVSISHVINANYTHTVS